MSSTGTGAAEAPPPRHPSFQLHGRPALLSAPFVSPRERHLKWPALDWVEAALYLACGACIIGFSLAVLCDVGTREIGRPWLWLQLVTTGFFAWGVFIGMAVATRRLDHLNLVEITKGMSGPKRSFMEIVNRLVILAVGIAMLVFGFQNFLNDMGSYRMPSLIPLSTYTASVPLSGALICLFCIEQIVNGWRHGFEGPEDKDDFAGIK
jgi:TRAP-type C4-dicarboxylate transport system permease small subunit